MSRLLRQIKRRQELRDMARSPALPVELNGVSVSV